VRPDLIDHAAHAFGLSLLERKVLGHVFEAVLLRRPAVRVADLLDGAAQPADVALLYEALQGEARLRAFALVEVTGEGAWLQRVVAINEELWPRFLGIESRERIVVAPAQGALDRLALSSRTRQLAEAATQWLREDGSPPTLVIYGSSGSGRSAVAHALTSVFDRPMLSLDGQRLTPERVAASRREIVWHGAIPIIENAELADAQALRAITHGVEGPVVLTCAASIVEIAMTARRRIHVLAIDPPSSEQRAAIWRLALENDQVDSDLLGSRFRFTPSRIVETARVLRANHDSVTTESAIALCRAIPELRVGGLAKRVSIANAWDDLVVNAAAKAELELAITYARRRASLFGPTSVGSRSRPPAGLACLFYGPPGCGKTMAAQVLAAELGRDLYRVDLSQVVDKYVGETEKRLDLLFREAAAADVVLFFDEADALFAQRTDITDAHDRYANLETGFLLQRLEEHPGVVLLATNLLRNLDPAFQRRLSFMIEFPAPGRPERRAIWDRLLPQQRSEEIDLDTLSRVTSLSGGDIRNIVFAAILLADRANEQLGMSHLAIAIWREVKRAGRLLGPNELGKWHAVVAEYARSTQ
jgi:AAA+ superfamily predicted ATPase